ncbi:leucyl aminopeptidase (aminopeptidase T) [Anaerotaenia torta]|uniref:aminopeptidase n=1 Tax=Anaerotaenia torta TaxID=433293 RepID=UPI003D1DB7A9
MKYSILFKEDNEAIQERYELALERIRVMETEESVREPFRAYFQRTASFVSMVAQVADMAMGDRIAGLSLEELKGLNQALYEDLTDDHYQFSYANPSYACEKLGDKFGKLLSFLAAELRGIISYAYECRRYEMTIYLELLIEIYNYFEEEDEHTYKDAKRAVYDFMSDYCQVLVENRVRDLVDSDLTFAADIIMESDLEDLRYLYFYGEYITENEIKTAEFLNSLPQEQIQAMADTYTEGFRRGYIANRLDLSKKVYINIRYQIGFERMVRYAIHNFRKMGLEPTIYRAAYHAVNKRQHLKIGYHATSPNKQFDYDHRFDIGLFFDKAFKERRLECVKQAYEKYKEKAGLYAGPALIEVFGEELFAPKDKKEAVKLDDHQQKLYVEFNSEDNFIRNEYLKPSETSFTIIAYPVPEIGKDFNGIFAETVKVNNLDNDLYQRIQQCIIDALDQGEYVHILGAGENHTDLKVKLYELKDSSKESIFENCVADVNVPVGEVFTSPVLEGTNGVLHVSRIYLNDLECRELELTFRDGLVAEYSCANFNEAERNKSFVKENLLYNHDYLPLGEFAIGTNTTAYMMGRKFDIAPRLPILIAEKTGPHFAIGDTCYVMREDTAVFNPDGKETVARDNEISLLRKTEPSKAYFNCHTDITLPYDEIKEIAVVRKDGSRIPIIQDARFVLAGTEQLNEALDAE